MRILITGANGQLGKDLVRVLAEKHDVLGTDRNELDITNQAQCVQVINDFHPDVVIHTAAYTAVDKAESDPDQAFLLNAVGTRNVVIASEKVGAKFCYISTDYVFDGKGDRPYNEYDNTNPESIYGKSKRAGELFTHSLSSRYFIVRTSWVFGIHGNNFVKTMLKLGEEGKSLKVVCDQVGSPTYTIDLSRFLSELIETGNYGLYHASNEGSCSWFEFAKEIFIQRGINVTVDPCSTEDFPRPAPRPKYSVMDHMSIRTNGIADLPCWKDGLTRFFQDLEKNNVYIDS